MNRSRFRDKKLGDLDEEIKLRAEVVDEEIESMGDPIEAAAFMAQGSRRLWLRATPSSSSHGSRGATHAAGHSEAMRGHDRQAETRTRRP